MLDLAPIRLVRVETTEVDEGSIELPDFSPQIFQLTEDVETGVYIYEVVRRTMDAFPIRTIDVVVALKLTDIGTWTKVGGETERSPSPLAVRLTVSSPELDSILFAISSSASMLSRVKTSNNSLHRVGLLNRSAEIDLVLGAVASAAIEQTLTLKGRVQEQDGYVLGLISTSKYPCNQSSKYILLREKHEAHTTNPQTSDVTYTTVKAHIMETTYSYITGRFGIEREFRNGLDTKSLPGDRLKHYLYAGETRNAQTLVEWLLSGADHKALVLSDVDLSGRLVELPMSALFRDFYLP
ncbi:hypothetical protein [Ferrithrix thermotolerans]|nr:hypothetical protein [Ferrithrix thermotolerans]